MATEQHFLEYIIDQANLGPRLTWRRTFGEYGFHLDGKFVAMACDNSFFIKRTEALAALEIELPSRPPYPGTNPYPVADELLDDAELLGKLLLATAAHLPEPKPKRARTAKSEG